MNEGPMATRDGSSEDGQSSPSVGQPSVSSASAASSLPEPVRKVLARAGLRLRLRRAVESFAITGVAAAGGASLVVAFTKISRIDEVQARWVLVGAACLPVLGALVGALRPVSALFVAQLADRVFDLRGRLANAVAFSAVPATITWARSHFKSA